MRKIGIKEIEDIATGAALLGAGGGGDPYVGKLMAIGAVRDCGPVTLLDPDEVPDDALVVPIAMMGAPTVLAEKAVGGTEYQKLFDMVSNFFGKKIYAFMPIDAGGVNSMLPVAAAANSAPPSAPKRPFRCSPMRKVSSTRRQMKPFATAAACAQSAARLFLPPPKQAITWPPTAAAGWGRKSCGSRLRAGRLDGSRSARAGGRARRGAGLRSGRRSRGGRGARSVGRRARRIGRPGACGGG